MVGSVYLSQSMGSRGQNEIGLMQDLSVLTVVQICIDQACTYTPPVDRVYSHSVHSIQVLSTMLKWGFTYAMTSHQYNHQA